MRPYGFDFDRKTILPNEANVIKDSARRFLAGESLRSIADDLVTKGNKTPGGKNWTSTTLRRVLLSARVAGQLQGPDGSMEKAPWPAILDKKTATKLHEKLNEPSRKTTKAAPPRTYLLTGGLTVCGLCGSPLIARPNNDGRRGYVCTSGEPYRGCGRIRIIADKFEEEVVERVLARLLRDDAKDMLARSQAQVEDEAGKAPALIKNSQNRLNEISADYVDGNISAKEMAAARQRLSDRIAKARSQQKLGELLKTVDALQAEDLIEWWEGASREQQRGIIDLLVSKIEVLPQQVRGSKIFDPNRVKVHWRRGPAKR